MIFLSIQRLVILLRVHWRLLLYSAALCSFVSFTFGSLTPYIFRSEAILMLPQPKTFDQMQMQDSTDVLRMASLFRSPKVLVPVAKKQIEKLGARANVLVPLAWSWFDIKQRLAIFRSKILGIPNNPDTPQMDTTDPEIFASLMVRQINAEPDGVMRTVKVVYEAADSAQAQNTCEILVDEFLKVITAMEQEETQRQENYLLGAIQQQLTEIKDTEAKMRAIVERYPELSSAGGEKSGVLANKLLEKQEMLKRLQSEFDSNRKFLEGIQGDLGELNQTRDLSSKMSNELSSKVAEEISDLQFRKLQYTQVSGYAETHPEIMRIQTRIDTLRKVLANPGGSRMSSSTLKNLYQKKNQLSERNKTLGAEKEMVNNEIEKEESKFKELVKRNFDLDSLMRNLQVNVSITGELYRELQKTRLVMAGAKGKATILSPATLSVHASNISVKKRAVFGFVIGVAVAFSLLILFDFFSPILLHEDDLSSFKERIFGPFRSTQRGKHQLYAWFSSLRLEKARRHEIAPVKIRFGLLGFSSATRTWEPFVLDSLKEMKNRGEKVGVIVIRDPEAWEERFAWNLGDEHAEELIIDDVPNQLELRVAEIEARVDYTFIILPENTTGIPIEPYIDDLTDHTLIVSQVGLSSLKNVRKISLSIEKSTRKSHLVLAPYHSENALPFTKRFFRKRGGRPPTSSAAA